jgi:class 3 adenylate cyclase
MTAAMLDRPPAPTRRERLTPGVRLYLLVGIAALAAFYAMPANTLFQDAVYYPAIGLASVVAIVAGVAWYRPAHPAPWLLFATGQLLFVAGDILFGYYEHVANETPFPSAADALYLLAYPVLASGLWLLVRQRTTRTDLTSLIDAATVTVALGIVVWELLIVPYTRDDTLSTAEKAISIAYPLGDVLLLAVAARLLFGTALRSVSYALVALSLVCLLIADPIFALDTIRGDHGSGGVADAGWILAYLFFGAAALHPSMPQVSEPAPETAPKLTAWRLVLLGAAALAAPAVLAYEPERLGVACTAVLIVLVGARLAGIVARHERALARESRLREAAATLVAATTDAEIHRAAVETAVAFAGVGARATLTLEHEQVASAGVAGPGVRDVFPLAVMGARRGELEVETVAGVDPEDLAVLETLADQVALALETVARAREKADAERRRVHDLFSRFVPEAVVEELLTQTGGARLGGRALEGTIMFTDLRGFTSFSESRPADEVIAVINRILSEQTETIMAHGGTIIAYLGDGLMAAFGAPLEQPDHAERALAAARDLVGETLPALNAWMREQGHGDGFRMGVGVNSGSFISGNVGHERRLEYTAIGDVCNTASRIEGLTKGTRHQLLFSGATLRALAAPPDDLVDAGESAIRGRQAHAELWSLEAISDAA